jgi:CHAT domain-containing protein
MKPLRPFWLTRDRSRLFPCLFACLLTGFLLAFGLSGAVPAAQFSQTNSLPNQAERQLQRGQPEAALETWKQAEQRYRQQGNDEGVIGSQINQARALQAAGFYRRAKTLLEEVARALEKHPNTQLQLTGLLNLGNVLRSVGDLNTSQTVLQQALTIAQARSPQDAQIAAFQLANTRRSQQQNTQAIALYQQAVAPGSPVRIQAQINLANLWIDLRQPANARALIPQITQQLLALPPNPISLYGQIALAESWQRLNLDAPLPPSPLSDKPASPNVAPSETQSAAQLMARAIRQAQTLGDRRAESYAVGKLGRMYETTEQWQEAEKLTQRAWQLAHSQQAIDLSYQWQWQWGRLRNVQGDRDGAIAHYTEATTLLRSLRADLISINPDVQFSFREQVEPVYREFVDLLLHEANPLPTTQQNLQQARQLIESLQLAELTNFFRTACLDLENKPQQIDTLDSKAAVVYPIILPDRLEVIVAVPGKPLLHYHTQKTQAELEQIIQQSRNSLRPTAFVAESQTFAAQLYDWLIRPAANTLAQQHIQTLVFVLDGSLRGIPMAVLYDGQQYLVERYRLALAPGLQLIPSTAFRDRPVNVLVAGLSEAIQGFAPMPAVAEEVEQIQQAVPTQTLLNETFTFKSFQQLLSTKPFTIVHLATHGQFSFSAEQTFLLTWDDRITVGQLDSLLRKKENQVAEPLELLILSACETALGDRRAELGMAGIALRSGARSTLATLWLINDESTGEFMAEFYRQLIQTKAPKAEALRQAQLKLLANPQFHHPFYWAPFVLIGNWF